MIAALSIAAWGGSPDPVLADRLALASAVQAWTPEQRDAITAIVERSSLIGTGYPAHTTHLMSEAQCVQSLQARGFIWRDAKAEQI